MSLRLRLILLLLVVYSLGGWLITRWAIGQVRPRYVEAMEETMVETALLLSGVMEEEDAVDAASVEALRRIVENTQREPYRVEIFSLVRSQFQLRVMVANAEGRIVFDSRDEAAGELHRGWAEIGRTLDGGYGARGEYALKPTYASRDVLIEGEDAPLFEIYVGAPVYQHGEIAGVVSVGKRTSALNQLIRAAQWKIFLGMAAGGVALLVVLLLGANWIVGPLERLGSWARAIRDGEQREPPKVPGGTLGALRSALVEMRDTLEGRDAIERYTRTLAHEIKAPLTAISGSAELLREDLPTADRERFEEAIREGADRIQRIVDELLALARIERSQGVSAFDSLDLRTLLEQAVADVRDAYVARSVVLCAGPLEEIRVTGDPVLLRRAIANLLHNAMEFSPAGATVEYALLKTSKMATVRIRDEGAGIPDFAQDRLFERFYSLPRPETGKKSTGLGLSMVHEIMELHGGSIRVLNQPGGGAEACLTFWR